MAVSFSGEFSQVEVLTGSEAVVAQTFNPSTLEADAGGLLSSRLTWLTE